MDGIRDGSAGPLQNDRTARLIVWTVWAGMVALLLWSYIPISSPIPLAEDWYTVPLITGQQVDLGAWLWEQNNEHRMPVARLLLLGALKASGGDYRAGGLLNLALLAAGAAGLILFVRHLRGGRTDVGDAFLPLTLLHFGHSVDVLFPFQITFVLSLGLIMLVGCTLFLPTSLTSRSAAAVGGGALLLLPLSGFIGLLFVPALAAYVFYAGWSCWTGSRGWPRLRPIGAWLMAASVVTFALAGLYFIGYQHPWWNPPNPGIIPSTKVVLQVLSLGFGAAPYFWFKPARHRRRWCSCRHRSSKLFGASTGRHHFVTTDSAPRFSSQPRSPLRLRRAGAEPATFRLPVSLSATYLSCFLLSSPPTSHGCCRRHPLGRRSVAALPW